MTLRNGSNERYWTTGLLSFIIPIPIFLMGFTLGFPSSAILDLKGDATELPDGYILSTYFISLFVSLAPVGAIAGGPVGGWIAQKWGRKCSLMFSGVPFMTGYLLLSYAHYASSPDGFRAILLTGRFACGIGIGWSSAVVPVYLGEVSSAKLRGNVGAISQTMFTSGIVFSYALGAIDNFRYYYISLVAVGIVAVFEVLMLRLPETPRWLMSKGNVKKTEEVLLWLRGKKIDVKKEVEDIRKVVLATRPVGRRNILKSLSKRNFLIPFVYILILFFFHQAGGISATASFAATIFSDAGISNPRLTTIFAVGISSLIGNIATFFLVNILGRVTLLITSATGMFLGCSMLGIHFFITRASLCNNGMDESCNPQFGPLAVASLTLYRFSFAIGVGPLPWILISELLPLSVRGFASGLVMIMTWGVASAVTGLYLEYVQLVQPWFAIWTFGLMNLSAVIFIIIFLPETKGKSLEELERTFIRKPKVVETVL